MTMSNREAPFPELRIVAAEHIHPHEEHDSQRSAPLVEKLRKATSLTNPPIVAPINDDDYVILDGANRYHSLTKLGYTHLLVQIATYDRQVRLGVWQHLIADWERVYLIEAIQALPDVEMRGGWDPAAIARIILRDGLTLSAHANVETVIERNALLRNFVQTYQTQATLYRTALDEVSAIWNLYPQAVALVQFPHYHPEDIIQAARLQAFLPPGISRHIIAGRALSLNYPLAWLKDEMTTLDEKNIQLQNWLKEQAANRAVRYYAESTYQFSE